MVASDSLQVLEIKEHKGHKEFKFSSLLTFVEFPL